MKKLSEMTDQEIMQYVQNDHKMININFNYRKIGEKYKLKVRTSYIIADTIEHDNNVYYCDNLLELKSLIVFVADVKYTNFTAKHADDNFTNLKLYTKKYRGQKLVYHAHAVNTINRAKIKG